MPIYRLTDQLLFPPAEEAVDGIVAVGGDLSVERLKLAYQHGIFPWYNSDEPIIWWSPDPRFVLFPEKLRISKSMKQVLRNHHYRITINHDFEQVIDRCRSTFREGQEDTWITAEMCKAYLALHRAGWATSVEVWKGDELVGGLYGVEVGNVFCGESMFHTESNASKIAFIEFVCHFRHKGGKLIDCQIYTEHLLSLGAEHISRREFLVHLSSSVIS